MATDTRIRTKHPEVRRDQLLDAAEGLFATKGYADTTVADIAEAAGVAKGTFYLYFPSKDHIVVALKERMSRGLMDRFLSVIAPALEDASNGKTDIDIVQITRDLIDQTFELAAEKAELFVSLFHRGDTIEVDRVALASEDEMILVLTQAFNQMNDLGVTRVTHPEHTARILFSGVHWAVDRTVSREKTSKLNLEELKEASIEVIVRSLGVSY